MQGMGSVVLSYGYYMTEAETVIGQNIWVMEIDCKGWSGSE